MVQSSARLRHGSSAPGYNGADFGPCHMTVNLSKIRPTWSLIQMAISSSPTLSVIIAFRKIDTSGNITTVAGLAVSGQSGHLQHCAEYDPAPQRRRVSINQPA